MRDIFTIAQCMWRGILSGWLSFLMLVGVVALMFILAQAGPAESQVLLAQCRGFGLKLTLWTCVMLVVIVGSTELPREVQSGTIFFLLTKPVARCHVVLGKLAGLLVVAYSYILLQTAVGILVPAIRGLGLDWGFFLETLLITARVTILAASVVMFSTVLPEFPTIFFSAIYLVVGILTGLFDALISYGPFESGARVVLRIIYYSAPNYSLFIPHRLSEAATSWKFVLGIGGYTLCYTALLAWLGIWAFSRREFSGR